MVNNIDDRESILMQIPRGWRKAFGPNMIGKLDELLSKTDYKDKYYVIDIKEKFGALRWYDSGVPDEIWDEYNAWIHKYEKLSAHTCINCGAKATRRSTGYILPFCDECAAEFGGNYIDIEER